MISAASSSAPGRVARVAWWQANERLLMAAALAGALALTVLCRLPFLQVPLTNDEGGYAYVARLWAHGAPLYGAAWVDRPQGLALLFRLFVALAPSTEGLRLGAAVYAGLSALALAYVGALLFGRWAGVLGAVLYAIFSSGPQIEGFILNGELLATLPTVLAVALAVQASRVGDGTEPFVHERQAGQGAEPSGKESRTGQETTLAAGTNRAGRVAWLLTGAGAAAGCALLVKQSAIDGPVIVLLYAAFGRFEPVAPSGHRRPIATPSRVGSAIRRVSLVLAGLLGVLALSAAHGLLTGWTDYINAVVLDNLRYRTFDAASVSLGSALPAVGSYLSEDGVLVAGVLAALLLIRNGAARWWLLCWLVVAAFALTLGGLYSRHYFVQLLPPLCLLAAAGLAAGARLAARRRVALVLWAVPLAAISAAVAVDGPLYAGSSPVAVSQSLYGWAVYTHQAQIVRLLDSRVPPGEPFFVAYAAAPLHYLTGRPSVTRYLWRRPLGTVPGAYGAALAAVERGTPVCIVAVQPVAQTPGDARMRAAIARRYRVALSVPGVAVYCRPVRT